MCPVSSESMECQEERHFCEEAGQRESRWKKKLDVSGHEQKGGESWRERRQVKESMLCKRLCIHHIICDCSISKPFVNS